MMACALAVTVVWSGNVLPAGAAELTGAEQAVWGMETEDTQTGDTLLKNTQSMYHRLPK